MGRSVFMMPVRIWLDRNNAPTPVGRWWISRTTRGRKLSRGSHTAEVLLTEARGQRFWVEPDLLREGAVIALLAADRAADARGVIDSLTPVARRGPDDVRTRLLLLGRPQ